MKFLTSLTLSAALATTALAQTILIQSPLNGTAVQAGSNITVEVVQRGSLTPLVQVALAIGLGSPNSAPAIGGNILYNGPFDPEFENTGITNLPGQNFTVTIPESTPAGLMSLNVARFDLITEQHLPNTQTVNVTLNVV
ncbi:hypothetical protein DFH08DRAFT_1028236 [Mycena albidolilacea]|uniref:Uncharacterized protein n=1 Tax=Mycena albidolilacea TaxID=1033008 RepID=A0AAD6ZJB9_9AGAR|nr:hypothetical protein DFH08DRAFT_1028236 [Mycena albidolilacea]